MLEACKSRIFGPACFLVTMLLAALLFCFSSFSRQHAQPGNSERQPILEVVEISGAEWESLRYLYLRVFPDGKVEFHDPIKIDLTRDVPLIRGKLSEQEMARLVSLLGSRETRGLSGTFERGDMGVIRSLLMIRMARDDDFQDLEFVNFDSDNQMDGGRAYTAEADRLGCTIERLRRRARNDPWESPACKKITGES